MNHQPLHPESFVVQAVGDGNANDHAAIQRALDQSRDVAPDTPTLRIKHVAADVVMRQADQRAVVQRIGVNDTVESQTDAIAELHVRGIE